MEVGQQLPAGTIPKVGLLGSCVLPATAWCRGPPHTASKSSIFPFIFHLFWGFFPPFKITQTLSQSYWNYPQGIAQYEHCSKNVLVVVFFSLPCLLVVVVVVCFMFKVGLQSATGPPPPPPEATQSYTQSHFHVSLTR